MDDVREYLAGQDKDALVDMPMKQAMDDDRLRQRLMMKAAKKGPKCLELETYRRAIDEAVDIGGFVEYGAAYDNAQGIEDAIDSIEELLKEGHAAEVIEIVEHALAAVEEAMGSIDDSDDHMGGILERLQRIHLAACKKVKPDPEALAKRLFEWEFRTDWDTFHGAAATYAGVLGEKGLAMYRELAEAAWARVPALGTGGHDPEKYGGGPASHTSWRPWLGNRTTSRRSWRSCSATSPPPTTPVSGKIVPGRLQREDRPLIPPDALREIAINALVHRDYTIARGDVALAIFDDRGRSDT